MQAGYKEVILIDEAYLNALLTAINEATQTIDMEVYIFEEDAVGTMVAQALYRAAKRGVRVRLLVDGIGSINWGGKLSQQMEAAGIQMRIFHPLPWKIYHWKLSNFSATFLKKIIYLFLKINSRNHRKVCLIDNAILFVGSANINNHLITNEEMGKNWRETSAKLLNGDFSEVQYAFNKAWGNISFKTRLYAAFNKNKNISFFRLNFSLRRRKKYYYSLLKRIASSKKNIWVTSAYFIPDSFLLKSLIRARARGVDVRILLPARSDILLVSLASETFYAALIKNGILIYEYLPSILHAKILMIDDWYSIGSSNLNYRSFKHDLEIDVNIQTEESKQLIYQQFLADLNHSHLLTPADLKRQTFLKKIFAHLILLIRYII